MHIYKAEHWLTHVIIYFTKHPSKKNLLVSFDVEEDDYDVDDWEITRLDVVENKKN